MDSGGATQAPVFQLGGTQRGDRRTAGQTESAPVPQDARIACRTLSNPRQAGTAAVTSGAVRVCRVEESPRESGLSRGTGGALLQLPVSIVVYFFKDSVPSQIYIISLPDAQDAVPGFEQH